MKAQEYFDKYGTRIMGTESNLSPEEEEIACNKAACELMTELLTEAQTLMKTRHVSTDNGMVSIIKELNQKWNAICCLFEKQYGVSPLIRDGYKNYWIDKIPEMACMM